jgi:PAS domain S-box-containing protein
MAKTFDSIQNAPFGYALHKIVLDDSDKPVDYEFIEVNAAFEKITGLKRSNIIGKKVKQVLPQIAQGKFDWIGFYGKVALENSVEIFEQYSEPLAKHYSVHAYSPEKEYFITVFNDVTESISEYSRLRSIIGNAIIGTWEWNIQTGETTFNEQWANIVGYSLEELSPTNIDTWTQLVHPDDLIKSNGHLNAHFNGKSAEYRAEARMRHKKGHWVWVLDWGKVFKWTGEGKPLLMSGFHQDISERKKAELQLHQNLEIQKLVSEISTEFIHTKDIDASIIESFSRLGAVTHASRVYMFMLDAENETMSNTHEWCSQGVSSEKGSLQNLPLSLFPWWMQKIYNNTIINVPDVSQMPPEAKTEQEILESQNIKSLLVFPVRTQERLIGFVGFDNTSSIHQWDEWASQLLKLFAHILSNAVLRRSYEEDLKKLINQLLEAKSKAEESDRLKSAFLATMNHELRTPLNHVLGFSEIIPDMTDDETIKEFSGLIHKSGSDLLNIIEDVFDLAMIEQSEIHIRQQKVSIRDLYLGLKKQLQEVLSDSNKSDHIRLEYKIDSSIVSQRIVTDRTKVMQVMLNIIKNAVKFTHDGTISLALMLEQHNQLSIKVKDTGVGMSKDTMKCIFEVFRQGDDTHTRKYEGVGIGLAISNKIAQVMGGAIKVESEPNVGSEFTFSLPVGLCENEMLHSEQENPPLVVPHLSGTKVLVVEDDTIATEILLNMLKPLKCEILCASNGREAIETMKINSDTGIVLIDLKMPVMDGFDATRAIRRDFPELPIIALTAYSLQKDKTKALAAGCNDIITKPISKEILFMKLQAFLGKQE